MPMTVAYLYPLDFISYPPVAGPAYRQARPMGLPTPMQGSNSECLAIEAFIYNSSLTDQFIKNEYKIIF